MTANPIPLEGTGIEIAPHVRLMHQTDNEITEKLQPFCLDLKIHRIVVEGPDPKIKVEQYNILCNAISEQLRINFKLCRQSDVTWQLVDSDQHSGQDLHIDINVDYSPCISALVVTQLVAKHIECDYVTEVSFRDGTLRLC